MSSCMCRTVITNACEDNLAFKYPPCSQNEYELTRPCIISSYQKCSPRGCTLHLLSPCAASAGARAPGACALQREATALRHPRAAVKSDLHSLQLEEPEFSNKDPDEPKLNKQMNNTRNTATQKFFIHKRFFIPRLQQLQFKGFHWKQHLNSVMSQPHAD